MTFIQNNPLSRKVGSPLNEGGYCAKSAGKSGCVTHEGGSWRVISNKTGKLWDAHYDSRSDAEAALRAYHAGGPSRKSSSPVNYSGLPGVNEDMALVDIEEGHGESDWEAHHGDKKGVAPSRHGSMTGDQSATHPDYADFKDTDPHYHGHEGESHGDQSATDRDYMSHMGHHIDPRTKR